MAESTPIKLVISDIDGTLVRKDKSLSEATIAAFADLSSAGVATSLISARPPSGMIHLAKALRIRNPMGAFNGGIVFRADGTITRTEHIDPDVSRTLLALAPPAIDVWLFAQGRWYAPDAQNQRVPRERLSALIDPIETTDFSPFLDDADKIVFVSEDPNALARLESLACDTVGPDATIALSQPYFLDVTAPLANKGDGIAALAQALDIPLSAVAVIGDMANDIPMFKRAGLAIAMGQAPDAVRDAADFVTATEDEDGLAKAIEQFILPRIG